MVLQDSIIYSYSIMVIDYTYDIYQSWFSIMISICKGKWIFGSIPSAYCKGATCKKATVLLEEEPIGMEHVQMLNLIGLEIYCL